MEATMWDAVGIVVLDRPPSGVDRAAAPSKHCTLVGQARQGKTLWAGRDDINCPLARFALGIDAPDVRTLDALAATLLEWKAAKDRDAALAFLSRLPRLPFQERVFVYAPLRAATTEVDLVVRIVQPEEAMRRLRALSATTGERAEGRSAGIGALCSECTAFPLVSGTSAISPGCPGSRREAFLQADQMFLALPASPASLDRASA
jgi:uncharacterized protein (DUF169 family)